MRKTKTVSIITLLTFLLLTLTSCSAEDAIAGLIITLLDALVGIITTILVAAGPIMIIITVIAAIIIVFIVVIRLEKKKAAEEAEYLKREKELEEIAKKEAQRIHQEQEELLKKEREEAQRKYKEELERKRKTKCIICHECSMGNTLCTNCQSRLDMLRNEVPRAATVSYEALSKHYKASMQRVINMTANEDKIYYSTYLLAVADKLNQKYYIDRASKNAYSFLKDYSELNFTINEELLKRYNLNGEPDAELPAPIVEIKTPQISLKDLAEQKEDKAAKQQNGKTFRCNDGDHVRSKAEREIDNFFYANRIWHIYEYRYEHPITKEWASPDFYLPDYNLFIEYFGLNTPEYIEKREHKIKMYRSDKSIRFDYLTYEDDADLNAKLLEICKKHEIPLK